MARSRRRDLEWLDHRDPWLAVDLLCGILSLIAVLLLARRLLRVGPSFRRILALVLAHAADGVTFVLAVRAQPHYFLSYRMGVVLPTVLFYAGAALSLLLLLYALRLGFTFDAVSSFAFPGSFVLLSLKAAFALAYASPVGGILAGLSFAVTLVQTVVIKVSRKPKKKEE
jgi:hypothetical protein